MREITRDPKTPATVSVRRAAREPMTDPTAGIPLPARPVASGPAPKHRLVTIGDSLTQGFQSGSVYRTELSFPRLIAKELGWDAFRFPRFPGAGGLPLNIEYIVRRLEEAVGNKIDWWKAPVAALKLRAVMDEIEDYWERGEGAEPPPSPPHPRGSTTTSASTAGICAMCCREPRDRAPDRSRSPATILYDRWSRTRTPGRPCGCCHRPGQGAATGWGCSTRPKRSVKTGKSRR
jgi:hypothetical protein